MLMKAGIFLLTVAVLKVSAEYAEPRFIEDVNGSPQTRIVSGWEAILGQHPHQANIRMVDASGDVFSCGGSFVHREWVITAAHCTALRITLVIRGGMVNITTPEYIVETTEWWNHPSYIDQLSIVQPNDISLVKLPRPFTYTRNLKPIRIQPSTEAYNNYQGERVHTSGYGRTWTGGATTEVLRWVYLVGVSNANCAAMYGSTLINANAICAQWYNVTSQSTCHGDSGGPLVHVNSNGEEILIGVTSFVAGGDFGCHSGLPAGFVRPGPFHSWFTEVSGIDFENLEDEEETTTTTTTSTTTTQAPTSTTTQTPTTTTPTPPSEDDSEEEGGESEEDGSGDDDSSSEEDDDDSDMSELLKRLQVQVKVKVNINKFKSKRPALKGKKH